MRGSAFVLVVAVAVAACGSSGKKSITQTTSGPSGATSSAATTTTAVVESAKLRVEQGFSSWVDSINTRNTSAGAVVTNPRKTQAACGVQVTFNLKDASGAVVDTKTENVSWIPAGARVLVAPLQIGFGLKTEPKQLGVTTIVDSYTATTKLSGCPSSFTTGKGVPMDVISATIQRDQYGISQVTGQVKNPTSEVVQYPTLDCIFRASTAIAGGLTTAITDPIPPGGTIAFKAGIADVPPNANAVECQVIA